MSAISWIAIDWLEPDLEREAEDVAETEVSAANLEALLAEAQEELKAIKRQRVRDIMKHPRREETLEATCGELEDDLLRSIEGLQNQVEMTAHKRNTILRINRVTKTAMEVVGDILTKDELDGADSGLVIEQIHVFEDHLGFKLKADIDSILKCGALPEIGGRRQFYPNTAKIAFKDVLPVQSSVGWKYSRIHYRCGGTKKHQNLALLQIYIFPVRL